MENIRREIPNHFSLPRRIGRLGQLAYNLWWVWNPEGQMLYSQIDKPLWDKLAHNPVSFLRKVERARLNAVTNNLFYLSLYDRVMANFDQYMAAKGTWYENKYPELTQKQIAYFSFEFGLHESLPIYAGGLGILAGDHIKEASDLGVPMVGVSFVYNKGFFTQWITEDGWQETRDTPLDFSGIPILPITNAAGSPVTVSVELPERKVLARLWQIQVGRVPLILLDSNVAENTPADRQLTARLYTSDLEVRISQEILLGMGGVRALRVLGYKPEIWHMNEGHSAFLTLERAMEYVESGLSFEDAAEKVRQSNIFTTHTPVPAGNDQFPMWLMDKYFGPIWSRLGIDRDQFVNLACHSQSWSDMFSMPVLALRLSNYRNAVSELHGKVSRHMWNFIWPDRQEDDVPITHITNGVHTGSWLARRMGLLFDQYLGSDWLEHQDNPEVWAKIENIPDEELLDVRQHLKRKLVTYATEHARQLWSSGSVPPSQVLAGGVFMESYSLTIGFARRFATYKRANLIFRNPERLLKILNNTNMPVQLVFAGKAHPADEPGKMVIQQVYRAIKESRSQGRMIFLEDYDINIARYLVQGVDVWLNTPRRPNEASGTSGMKAALNGVLNLSVLDGWWREGYNEANGWAIGDDEDCDDPNQQDDNDAESLYNHLENEIVPLYYSRTSGENLPHDWLARVKESIRTIGPNFNTRRMVVEYINHLYAPALKGEALPEEDI